MNIALIFAGGTGQRMNSKSKPKQFLELYGKPIIVYTLEYFESHEEIDAICIVCVRGWEKELKRMLIKNDIHKVRWITEGGSTGHDSIFNGLKVLEKDCDENDIILIHDAVRPLISKQLISENLEIVKKYGNAITVESARESVIGVGRNRSVKNVPARDLMRIAKAPQSFYLKDILEVHRLAEK